jgi:hypothetical protein
MDQSPTLGYHMAIFARQTIGAPRGFVYGSPGSYASVLMGAISEGGGGHSSVLHIGGASVAALGGSNLKRSENLGVSQIGWTEFNDTPRPKWSLTYDGVGLYWGDEHAAVNSIYYSPGAFNNLVFPYPPSTVFVDISPMIGGIKFFNVKTQGPSVHTGRSLVFVDGFLYGSMQNPLATAFYFMKKPPGTGGWTMVASFPSFVAPIEVFVPDSSKWAGYSLGGNIIGSSDGGATWTDKNGNIFAALGIINFGVRRMALKFSVGAA